MNKPIKIIKTPVSIQSAIDFATERKHHWSGELARAEACFNNGKFCCYVGQGCDPLCPHL